MAEAECGTGKKRKRELGAIVEGRKKEKQRGESEQNREGGWPERKKTEAGL